MLKRKFLRKLKPLALNKCISIITVWYQVVTAEECSFTSVRYRVINSASANDLLSQRHIRSRYATAPEVHMFGYNLIAAQLRATSFQSASHFLPFLCQFLATRISRSTRAVTTEQKPIRRGIYPLINGSRSDLVAFAGLEIWM